MGAGVPLRVGAAAPPPPPRGACLFISKIVVVRLRRRALGEGTCLKAQGRAGAFGVRRMGIHIPWASVVDEVMGTRNMVGAAHGILSLPSSRLTDRNTELDRSWVHCVGPP